MVRRKNRRQKSSSNSPFPAQLAPASLTWSIEDPEALTMSADCHLLVVATTDPAALAGWFYVFYGPPDGGIRPPVALPVLGISGVDSPDGVRAVRLEFGQELQSLEGSLLSGLVIPINQRLVQGVQLQRLVASTAWDGILGLAASTESVFLEHLVPDGLWPGPGWKMQDVVIPGADPWFDFVSDAECSINPGGSLEGAQIFTPGGAFSIDSIVPGLGSVGHSWRANCSGVPTAGSPLWVFLPESQSALLNYAGESVNSGAYGIAYMLP